MNVARAKLVVASAAAAAALMVSGALANDVPVIPRVKTKVSVKAIPIVCPLTNVDGNSTFFGQSLPRQNVIPCLGLGQAKAKIVAEAGSVVAVIKVQDKANPNAVVSQQVAIQARLHDDGCTTDYIIPELTFAGPSQGLPDAQLVDGRALITVTSDQILNGNPGLFPSPRPLCPSDVYTSRHRLIINGCWYEAVFTIHHAG
jgi:hypothetical protein